MRSPVWVVLAAGMLGLLIARPLDWFASRSVAGLSDRETHPGRFACQCPATAVDAVPVLGWVVRRGKCGQCASRARHPMLGVACGGLWAGTVLVMGVGPTLPAYLWFGSMTLILAVTDWEHHLIPNRVLGVATMVGLALLATGAFLEAGGRAFGEAVAAGVGYFAVMLTTALLARGGLGFGDVKLAFLLGVFTGYFGWHWTGMALFGAFLIGAVLSLVLLAARRRSTRDSLAFGPAMVLASWAVIVWSRALPDMPGLF